MNKKIGAWIFAAALSTAAIAPAQADLVTFDDMNPNVFGVGDSFTSGGFAFTADLAGFGVVDNSAGFVFGNAPTNAESQFYAGLNDGGLTMTTLNGRALAVDGFQFAFIPPVEGVFPPGDVPGYLVASYVTWAGDSGKELFEFSAADADGLFAFSVGKAGLGGLGQYLQSVTFFACVNFDGQCYYPAENQAQFAIDNIYARVPEPGSLGLALLGLGLMAGVGRRRRSN
jgi:hypothetical protein